MFRFSKYRFHSFTHTMSDGREIIFDAFWPGFKPENDFGFWLELLPRYCKNQTIRVLGPFWVEGNRPELIALKEKFGKWDYFITGENRENPVDLASQCIGYRLPRSEQEIRFPYWQWYLTWPGFEQNPPYERFGERLSLEKLMSPMSAFSDAPSKEEFLNHKTKAILLTSHLKRHRRYLFRLTDKAIGCDAYGRKIRPTNLAKRDLLRSYPFNLCPENRIAEGYITEKTPEAFLCGCVPISYCAGTDLERDFNPKAVVNVHGLGRRAVVRTLKSISEDYSAYLKFREQPLVLKKPDIEPLYRFLENR